MKWRFWKFGFEWKYPLDNPNCPSAYRWRIDFHYFSFRIHKWLHDDDDRAYHSHPWNFITFVLCGSYDDYHLNDLNEIVVTKLKTGNVGIRKRNYRHYVRINKTPTWTFLFTWGRYTNFAFWLKDSHKRKNRTKFHKEHGYHICDK